MASKTALFGDSSSGESDEEIDSSQEEDQLPGAAVSEDDSEEQEDDEEPKVQDEIEAAPSAEQEGGSLDAPLKGFDSQSPENATLGGVAGSDMSSEEGEGQGGGVAKKSRAVDAEALFGDESSDSADRGDASLVEAAASKPKPAGLHSQDLFGEDISSDEEIRLAADQKTREEEEENSFARSSGWTAEEDIRKAMATKKLP